MKKADLKPGMLVAVKDGYSINKAVVLEVGTRWGRAWGGSFVEKAGEPTQGVAIALEWRGEWLPRIVLLRRIIDTWEAYEAAQEKESQRRQAEREKRDAADEKDLNERTAARQRASRYGVALYTRIFEQGCVTLTLADLNKLLDLLDGKMA